MDAAGHRDGTLLAGRLRLVSARKFTHFLEARRYSRMGTELLISASARKKLFAQIFVSSACYTVSAVGKLRKIFHSPPDEP